MASITCLGPHVPTGLATLVSQGILPRDPLPQDYDWQTHIEDEVEHELLVTKTCVCWSRGGLVSRIFQFDHEQQDIRQAVLTRFPLTASNDELQTLPNKHPDDPQERELALVVLLKDLAHVYYLDGPSHVVNLPYEIESAFPSPHGLLLQRRSQAIQVPPVTPAIPAAPANSFRSSQAQPWASPTSFRSSFHQRRPRVTTQPKTSSQTSFLAGIDLELPAIGDFAAPKLLLMHDPLSDITYVSEALDSMHSSFPYNVDFDVIDDAESILHVSKQNMIDGTHASITLVVTFNSVQDRYTIWHAVTVDHDALERARSNRKSTSTSAVRSKRRSSFNPRTSTGTGTTTPTGRPRDVSRELGGGLQSQQAGRKARVSESFDVEDQDLDWEFLPKWDAQADAPLAGRDPNRRISSFVAREELVGNPQGAITQTGGVQGSFMGPKSASQSFGGNRMSHGRSRMSGRASTPGSISFLSDVDEVLSQGQAPQTIAEQLVSFSLGNNQVQPTTHRMYQGSSLSLTLIRVASIPATQITGQPAGTLPPPSRELRIFESRISRNSSGSPAIHLVLSYKDHRRVFQIQIPIHASSVPQDALSQPKSQSVIAVPSHNIQIIPLADTLDAMPFISQNQSLLATIRPGEVLNFVRSSHVNTPLISGIKLLDIIDTGEQSGSSLSSLDYLHQARVLSSAKTTKVNTGLKDSSFGNKIMQEKLLLVSPAAEPVSLQIALRPTQAFTLRVFEVCDLLLIHSLGPEKSLTPFWVVVAGINYPSNEVAEWHALMGTLTTMILGPSLADGMDVDSGSEISEFPTSFKQLKQDKFSSSWAWAKPASQQSQHGPERSNAYSIMLAQWAMPKLSKLGLVLSDDERRLSCIFLLYGLHLLKEELALQAVSVPWHTTSLSQFIARLSQWLGWKSWTDQSVPAEPVPQDTTAFADLAAEDTKPCHIFDWLTRPYAPLSRTPFPTWEQMVRQSKYVRDRIDYLPLFPLANWDVVWAPLVPRICALTKAFGRDLDWSDHTSWVEHLNGCGLTSWLLETLPEAVVAILRQHLEQCRANPPTTWSGALLQNVGRRDLDLLLDESASHTIGRPLDTETGLRDVHSICVPQQHSSKSMPESDSSDQKLLLTSIYREDKRWQEAAKLVNPLLVAVTEIFPRPGMSEAEFLEEQKNLAQLVYKRTMSLSAGQGIMMVGSRRPMMTEKMTITGFNTTCNFQPSNNTVTVDRANFTEDKVSWAFFHAGVSAGLRLAADTLGIDTSWFVLNRPSELGNRHAGLLLALGLRGHLRKMAKWLAFKYLTPKHNMTSIALLLGLSASYMGSMDAWVTRVLSVHVTRLLPYGAAELNLTPSTQAAGMMGIGLLYYNTQHRRMSEVLLSEVEYAESEDPLGVSESFRNETYRLAAGFGLGLVNIGAGKDLRSLHDMRVTERLLAVATGPRDVDAVHLLDQAVAGAIIALTLIFVKTEDKTIAKKINVPASVHQYDYIRPDILLLRTLAKHLILWSEIQPSLAWVHSNIPEDWRQSTAQDTIRLFVSGKPLSSHKIPFYNVLAGLCMSIALRFAGSGSIEARNVLLVFFDALVPDSVLFSHSGHITYDAVLTRNTVLRILNILSLSMAVVMAGTGDLEVFRRTRLMHSKVEPGHTFGLQQANHMATGILFMGRGQYTFNTSNLAIASLLCAFYPIFPNDVLDNQAHLQALRHMWIFAAEPRCLVPRDVESGQPIVIPVTVIHKDGKRKVLQAPCLMPELDSIARIETSNNEFWNVILDFENNTKHLAAFKKHQTVFLRRKSLLAHRPSAFESQLTVIAAGAQVSNHSTINELQLVNWLLAMPALASVGLTRSHVLNVLQSSAKKVQLLVQSDTSATSDTNQSLILLDRETSGVDDALTLRSMLARPNLEFLRMVKVLFEWAAWEASHGDQPLWLQQEWIDRLKVQVLKRLAAEQA